MAAPQASDPVDLPRIQTGANPQHLIITLLGDYWFGRKEHLPSAALVALANEFEITSTSARAALSRLARRGLLDSSRDGRRTFYGLTPRAERVLNEGFARIVGFGLDDRPWDGSWSVVIFSVPEDRARRAPRAENEASLARIRASVRRRMGVAQGRRERDESASRRARRRQPRRSSSVGSSTQSTAVIP